MKVTYKNDPGTLDPAVGDNWETRPMMRAIFRRPLGYQPGTTELTEEALQDAPWVPVYNQIRYVMHSRKVAGNPRSVFVDPGSYINCAYIYDASIQ